MSKKEDERIQTLEQVLGFVYRFPFNVNIENLVEIVHGPRTESNASYMDSKVRQIRDKGLPRWWCDLDLSNQHKVAKEMADRYGSDLLNLLRFNKMK